MKVRWFTALQYVKYFLEKEDRHSLQSPFVYQLYQGLKSYRNDPNANFPSIERFRNQLLEDQTLITVDDPGAGSYHFSNQRKVAEIARFSCSARKYNLLYQYFCSLTPAQTVLELGTSLGINSCYLAEVTQGQLYTMEAEEQLLLYAEKELNKYENIRLITGDISETLPTFLKERETIDFAVIDANHTYRSTLSYFGQILEKAHSGSVVVLGDIHWSREMNKAWKEILPTEAVSLSMDFFECGVLLFKKGMEKAHYVLSY